MPVLETESWQPALLESLRHCGVQREPVSWWRKTSIFLEIILIALLAGLARLAIQQLFESDPWSQWVFWVVFLCLFRVWLSRTVRTYRQMKAQSAVKVLESPKAKRPIFYLRSFALDARAARPTLIQKIFQLPNAEQTVTGQLRKLGPVIAIGRPGEKLPALGAARFYASDELWHAKVADVVDASQLVLWATGVTEGLRWEISHLIKNLPPGKLVLWAHPHLLRVGTAEREVEWAKFLQALGGVFPRPLPEHLGDARFICFAADWTPIPIAPLWRGPIRALRSFFNPLRSAMRMVRRVKQGKIDPQRVAYRHVERDIKEGDFARLIGVGDETLRWPNMTSFAFAKAAVIPVSLCLYPLVRMVIGPEIWNNPQGVPKDLLDWLSYTPWRVVPGALLFAAMQAACVIIAFRKLRNERWAAIIAAGAFTLLLPLGLMADPRSLDEYRFTSLELGFNSHGAEMFFNALVLGVQSILCVSASLLVLVYAVKRYMPSAKALLIGEFGGSALGWSACLWVNGVSRQCLSLFGPFSRPLSPTGIVRDLVNFLLSFVLAPLGEIKSTLENLTQGGFGPRENEILGLDWNFIGLILSSLVFMIVFWSGIRIIDAFGHRTAEVSSHEAGRGSSEPAALH
jgi:hypothetical protein